MILEARLKILEGVNKGDILLMKGKEGSYVVGYVIKQISEETGKTNNDS